MKYNSAWYRSIIHANTFFVHTKYSATKFMTTRVITILWMFLVMSKTVSILRNYMKERLLYKHYPRFVLAYSPVSYVRKKRIKYCSHVVVVCEKSCHEWTLYVIGKYMYCVTQWFKCWKFV